jgi:hypothetical protein
MFVSPLKTFEYDLAISNPVVLASVLKRLWPAKDGDVCKKLEKIIDAGNTYVDDNLLAENAKFIYTHIDDSKIGKGIFAQTLVEQITDSFIVPDYISGAILWACGGILIDE